MDQADARKGHEDVRDICGATKAPKALYGCHDLQHVACTSKRLSLLDTKRLPKMRTAHGPK